MRRSLFSLFCVGAASAAAGPLVSALLAAAVAPTQGAGSEATFAEHDAVAEVPVPTPINALRLAKLLQLEEHTAPTPEPPRRYRLRGTLAPMYACVEPIAGGPLHTYAPGDTLDDATVEEVGHGFVMLRRGDTLARLTLAATPATTAVTPSGARTQTLEVSRKDLEAARLNIFQLALQVRMVPAFEAGAAIGFRVAWMAPGALARKAGLEPGDVVTAVNGHSLTNLQDTAALMREASTSTQFSADIMRGGSPLRLEVKAL